MGNKTALKLIAVALAVYIAWVTATYLLEGRVNLLQRVDPVGRITYAMMANIAIGTILSAFAIRYLAKAGSINPIQLGRGRSRLTTIAVIAAAAMGGFAMFILQNPRTTEPMVVLNVFMQALPTSIAEVMVCWALVGTGFESLAKYRAGKVASVIVGAVAASVLFAVYHYAHSAPFNQTSVVLFLLLPSIATAVTYFLSRNIYAAIIIQNFMGILGVIANLPSLEPFKAPMVPAYAVAAASIAAVVVSVSGIIQRTLKRLRERRDSVELESSEENAT